jgi:hypothetical protein
MTIYNDFNQFKEAVRSAYENCWSDVFNYAGISPKNLKTGNYTYYEGTQICHKEKSPSVQEFPTTLYCRSCKQSFDIYALCAHATGKDFSTILKELGEIKGITFEQPKTEDNHKKDNEVDKVNIYSEVNQLLFAMFMSFSNHFLFKAANGEPFREYLQKRNLKLDYLESLEFKLGKKKVKGCGCVPMGANSSQELKKHMLNTLQNANLSKYEITTMEKLDEVLKSIELINDNGNFKLMGRVVFAVVLQEKIVNIYGRKISKDSKDTSPPHLYLKLENHGFYNFDDTRKKDYGVYVECIIDAISLMQFGINAFSTFGVGGWKSELCLKLLRNSNLKVLYTSYDKDKIKLVENLTEYIHYSNILQRIGPAGMKNAIKTGREIAKQTDIKVRVIDLPYDIVDGVEDKNDVNNIVIKMSNETDAEVLDYFLSLMSDSKDVDTSELLLMLEIMDKNKKYYNEQDYSEVITEVLKKTEFINLQRVLKEVAKKIEIPYEWLLINQLK